MFLCLPTHVVPRKRKLSPYGLSLRFAYICPFVFLILVWIDVYSSLVCVCMPFCNPPLHLLHMPTCYNSHIYPHYYIDPFSRKAAGWTNTWYVFRWDQIFLNLGSVWMDHFSTSHGNKYGWENQIQGMIIIPWISESIKNLSSIVHRIDDWSIKQWIL